MPEKERPDDRPVQQRPSPAPRSNPWPSRVIPAVTFLVGLALGGLLVGAAVGGGDDDQASGDESSTTPSPTTTPTTGATVVTVPAACQEAADNMREGLSLLRNGTDSVEKFQPDRIVKLLNRLEDIDQQTRPLVDECSNVDISRSPVPTESPSPAG